MGRAVVDVTARCDSQGVVVSVVTGSGARIVSVGVGVEDGVGVMVTVGIGVAVGCVNWK